MDVRDLLWGAAGENPKRHPLSPHHPHHHAQLQAAQDRLQQRREADVRAGAALSLREAVQRCASRLALNLAPGTPCSYEGALQPSSQARVVTEPHHPFRVIHVNRAWEQLCGWRASEVQGKTMAILQGRDTDPEVLRQVRATADSASRVQVLCVNYRKDGSKFLNRLQVSPLYDRSGRVSHLLGVLHPEHDVAAVTAHALLAAGSAGSATVASCSSDEAGRAVANSAP